MVNKPQEPLVIDPDNVPEIFCDGRVNLSIKGNLATLTFTHVRSDAGALFSGTIDPKSVVRARIVTTLANLDSLRELLNGLIQSQMPAPTSAQSRRRSPPRTPRALAGSLEVTYCCGSRPQDEPCQPGLIRR